MTNIRAWLFRILVLAAGGLFVYTWFQPWWKAFIEYYGRDAFVIWPYGFESYAPPQYAFMMRGAADVMPAWFTPAMWVVFGLLLAALLFSLFASSKKGVSLGKFRISMPTIITTVVGVAFIAIPVAAYIVISHFTNSLFDVGINDKLFIALDDHDQSWIYLSLQSNYWLAYISGPVLLVLTVLRRFIVGKDKVSQ
jgi:hypothetical protein